MASRKTIVIAYYGGAVSDDNTPIEGFHKIVKDLKAEDHKVLIYSESPTPSVADFCSKNKLVEYENESYDLLISPLALGCPINSDGYVDWDVARVLLESSGYLCKKTICQQYHNHIAPSKIKFNLEE